MRLSRGFRAPPAGKTRRTAADPVVLEGRGTLTRKGEEYLLTVPAGDFAFIRLRG